MEVLYDVIELPILQGITTEERRWTKKERYPTELLDIKHQNLKKTYISGENKTKGGCAVD